MTQNGYNGNSERAWVKLCSSEGEAELHLEAEKWELYVRCDTSAPLKLAASGSVRTDVASIVPQLREEPREWVCGQVRLDPHNRLVTVGEEVVELARKEYDLLLAMIREPLRVFTKRELLRDVWGIDQNGGTIRPTRTLDSHASRLRRKLGDGYVVNVWGVGYSFIEQSQVA